MTSLIDVVLLLLVFFMLSTTFSRFAELRVDLPHASAKAADEPSQRIELTIDRDGHYFVDQQPVPEDTPVALRQALYQALQGRDALPVQISADGRTPHQAVITAMDAARQVGLLHLAFATTEDHDQTPKDQK
jgi:biopolymer transport protein ExbD